MTKITPATVQGWATTHLVLAAIIAFAVGIAVGGLIF